MSNTVIFLDMDGVLQSPRYCVAIGETGLLSALEPAAMHMLRNLVVESDAKIVLSSSWRLGMDNPSTIKKIFQCCGFKALAAAFHDDWKTRYISGYRGDEIADWLSNHPEISNYLILDDDSDMLESQKEHFVQTDHMNGFLLEHYDQARKILNSGD